MCVCAQTQARTLTLHVRTRNTRCVHACQHNCGCVCNMHIACVTACALALHSRKHTPTNAHVRNTYPTQIHTYMHTCKRAPHAHLHIQQNIHRSCYLYMYIYIYIYILQLINQSAKRREPNIVFGLLRYITYTCVPVRNRGLRMNMFETINNCTIRMVSLARPPPLNLNP